MNPSSSATVYIFQNPFRLFPSGVDVSKTFSPALHERTTDVIINIGIAQKLRTAQTNRRTHLP
ncbi:hypothetical protein [Nodosilinea sp. LEGE 06152]|uniref:hypothetical protein n=1 Tax=Nodosilinea sp. LEGE 06152 TaxID=2777966 RepID=UPI00187F5E4C|nr:hypothetical protein [Nodosilinea sp. LEGE 06152]